MTTNDAGRKPSCGCRECEDTRQRHNALVANGLVSQARAVGRTYDALQAAHAVTPPARKAT